MITWNDLPDLLDITTRLADTLTPHDRHALTTYLHATEHTPTPPNARIDAMTRAAYDLDTLTLTASTHPFAP